MGCLDGDEIKNEVVEKPIPKGSKKVNILIDAPYNLKDTDAHSLYDFISMDNETPSLFIPEGFESAALFFSETDEVLAVVRTSPSDSVIKVNANTVAQALLTLVPSYHSLSKQQRDKFEREIADVPLYKHFVFLVDKNLKDSKPIYSTDSEFIETIVNLHVYINTTYLGLIDEENNGMSPNERKLEKQSDGDLKFSNWMKRDGGGTVTNRVSSYVYVSFQPNSGGDPIPKLLKPKSDEGFQFNLPSLKLKDDCYDVNINQTHYDVKSQNILAATITFTGLFFDTIFGFMPGQDKNACITAIAGSLIKDVTTTIMNAANLTALEYVDKTGETIWNGFKAGANQKNCLNFLTPEKIMLALGQQSAVVLKVVQAINIAKKTLEITGYLYPFFDPIEINETIQLYEGKLKEACVGVEKDGILKKEYASGETIHPGIILKAQSQYAEWEKSGFEVKWELLPGNGIVNTLYSKTSNEGKASVSWTLPNNISEATLFAHIKDKEGDHLTGSPIVFTTSVDPCLATSAPEITSFNLIKNTNFNSHRLYINFKAEGDGIIYLGNYFGMCDLNSVHCYPVRIYYKCFYPDGGLVWEGIGWNMYRVSSLSGNKNEGTLHINGFQSLFDCQYTVELMNTCNQRSNQISFYLKGDL